MSCAQFSDRKKKYPQNFTATRYQTVASVFSCFNQSDQILNPPSSLAIFCGCYLKTISLTLANLTVSRLQAPAVGVYGANSLLSFLDSLKVKTFALHPRNCLLQRTGLHHSYLFLLFLNAFQLPWFQISFSLISPNTFTEEFCI